MPPKKLLNTLSDTNRTRKVRQNLYLSHGQNFRHQSDLCLSFSLCRYVLKCSAVSRLHSWLLGKGCILTFDPISQWVEVFVQSNTLEGSDKNDLFFFFQWTNGWPLVLWPKVQRFVKSGFTQHSDNYSSLVNVLIDIKVKYYWVWHY